MNKVLMFGAGLWWAAVVFAGCTEHESRDDDGGYRTYGDTVKVLQQSWMAKLTVGEVKPCE